MLINRELILCKIESVYNTDPTPTGANDAIQVENISWSHAGLRMIERPLIRTSLGKLKQVFGETLMQISFDVELKYSGTAGTAPDLDPLFRSCGLGVTNVPATSDTYSLVSTAIESCTIYYYQDGMLYILTGCRGEPSFNLEAGNRGMMTFTMTGHTSAPADIALATPTYDASVPAPVIGASFTVDSYAAILSKLEFSLGNTIATPSDINASDGFAAVQITSRDVSGSLDPEAVLVATEAFDANFRSGAAMALTTGVIGPSAGNRWAITMPAVSYRSIAPGDRDGVRTYELGFGAAESSGDDEVSIAFT